MHTLGAVFAQLPCIHSLSWGCHYWGNRGDGKTPASLLLAKVLPARTPGALCLYHRSLRLSSPPNKTFLAQVVGCWPLRGCRAGRGFVACRQIWPLTRAERQLLALPAAPVPQPQTGFPSIPWFGNRNSLYPPTALQRRVAPPASPFSQPGTPGSNFWQKISSF